MTPPRPSLRKERRPSHQRSRGNARVEAPQPDRQHILAAVRHFVEPGQVVELRALAVSTPAYRRPHTVSGYYDDPEALARDAARAAPQARGVYVTLNPLNPALLARAANRLRDVDERDSLTPDTEVLRRRWLPVDVDPRRPSGVSATEAEHAAAHARALEVRAWLSAPGLAGAGLRQLRQRRPPGVPHRPPGRRRGPRGARAAGPGLPLRRRRRRGRPDGRQPGAHLEAVRHPGPQGRPPAGASPPPGPAAGGPRARRAAGGAGVTESVRPVAAGQLEAVAALAPREPERAAGAYRAAGGGAFDLDAWLAAHPLDLLGPVPWQGGRKWVFRVCPWSADHRDRSAYLVQFPGGAVAAGCHHNGCAGRDWRALRELAEPGRRDRRPARHAPAAPGPPGGDARGASLAPAGPHGPAAPAPAGPHPTRPAPPEASDGALDTAEVTKGPATRSGAGFGHNGHESHERHQHRDAEDATVAEALADAVAEVPELPAEVRLPGHLERVAAAARAVWLEPYVEAGRRLSPRTPRALHEAAGLFALMTAVARRAYVQAGAQRLYPSLFLAFVGRSTLYSKTTGLQVLRLTLELAGLEDLLLPASFTPQALLADLGLQVPPGLKDAPPAEREAWLARHRHGAQRAVIRDELAGLFEDCTKDYNAGLLPLLLKLDGAPERVDPDLTLSRGLVAVRRVCVSLIGATTPAALRAHAVKPYHWANGLFGRFALIAPGEPPAYAFWSEAATSVPGPVVQGLQRVYGAFPRPAAAFMHAHAGGSAGSASEPGAAGDARDGQDGRDARDEGARIVGAVQEGPDAVAFRVEPDAWRAWQAYDRALFGLAGRARAPERLDATYGRLPSAAIRVALALAAAEWALDGGPAGGPAPAVALRHWAAAQEVAERWRRDAHAVLAAALRDEDGDATQVAAARLVAALGQAGGRLGRREALRRLRCTAAQLDGALRATGGRVRERRAATGGRPAEWLELLPPDAPQPAHSAPAGPGGAEPAGAGDRADVVEAVEATGETDVTKGTGADSQDREARDLVPSGVTRGVPPRPTPRSWGPAPAARTATWGRRASRCWSYDLRAAGGGAPPAGGVVPDDPGGPAAPGGAARRPGRPAAGGDPGAPRRPAVPVPGHPRRGAGPWRPRRSGGRPGGERAGGAGARRSARRRRRGGRGLRARRLGRPPARPDAGHGPLGAAP